jgi:hypothetical protein
MQKLKLLIVLIILVVLIFGSICIGALSHASKHTLADSIGVTILMPTDNQECCKTSISEHIQSWKSTILILPSEARNGLILLLLELATTFAFVGVWFKYGLDDYKQLSFKFYERGNPERALFNELKLAFARGILNPKIY